MSSTTAAPSALEARLGEFLDGGYRALLRLRDQGVIAAFGAGVNEWQPCQWIAERGDFDIFLLAGRYTLLEQEALETLPAALRGARDRHRDRRPLQLGHPRHRRRVPAPSTTTTPRRRTILDRVARIEAVCARTA